MSLAREYSVCVTDIEGNYILIYEKQKRKAIRLCINYLKEAGPEAKGSVQAKNELVYQAHTSVRNERLIVVSEEL